MLHGYEGIVEVAITRLAAADRKDRGAREAEARRALRRFASAARTFVVGAPRVARWRSRYFEVVGDVARAKRWGTRESTLARELGLPVASR
ncbi:MAG: hypothetical protein RL846_01930 [Deltaproteobacteria bacterium]